MLLGSTDLHVQFPRPARPGRLLGRGRVVRRSRDVGFLAGELLDADGTVVAVATVTVQIRPGMLREPAAED
jgi:acyl-coenzyme A thioesterase PaaI-like protein